MNTSIMGKSLCLLVFVAIWLTAANLQAQQWQGNNNTTDPIGRTGNVGIGTTGPLEKLDVFGGSLYKRDASSGFKITNSGGINYIESAGAGMSGGADLYFTDMHAANTYMIIRNGGNVGIGTLPADKLQVAGKTGLGVAGSTSGQLSLYPNNAASWFHVDNRNDGSLRISHGATVGATDLVTIQNSGNVGIGTTNPGTAKLAVEGKINAREVVVTSLNPFPDYVFDRDYMVMPLDKLELHIKQNKRLPDIPSANEVEKNGINLGEMNIKLLKKIEELTLYVIDLQKQNETLKARMSSLEAGKKEK